MTTTRTVGGLSRLLVLVPVTVCATISYVSEDAPRCNNDRRSPPQTLAKCHYDADCIENAYCWNQEACFCKDSFVVYRNRSHVRCLKVATEMGDSCEADVQCHVTFAPLSECRENTCQCSSGSHFEEGRCYESVGLGQICQTHHNCYVKDSYCVSGFCECTLQHHPNPEKTGCLKSSYLGDKCNYDYDCVTEHSRCIDVCICKVDHVLPENGERCLKAANSIGEPCQENSQCEAFLWKSMCGPNGTCICMPGYHQRGSVCLMDVVLGEPCNTHRECVTRTLTDSNSIEVMNVNCTNGICVCSNEYTLMEELQDCVGYSDNGATRWQAYGILFILFLINL